MEKHTVVLDRMDYDHYRSAAEAFDALLEGKLVHSMDVGMGCYYYTTVSEEENVKLVEALRWKIERLNEKVKKQEKETARIEKKDNENELSELKKMSIFAFLKWRKKQ